MNACESEDQWSIELKMLVEHGERDDICFDSVTSSSIVEKQLSEELAVFRSMVAKCVEKTHRSNNVLMNILRERPVAASALHQPVSRRADEENRPDEQHVKMEQESFQSKHVSGLESNATTQQSVSLSHDQVYEEEMVRSKKSRNNAWLDTQKKPVLAKSRLVVKQVRRASKRKDVCTGTPSLEVMSIVLPRTSRGHGSCIGLSNVSVVFVHGENEAELLVCLMKSMRNDETTWKLLMKVHGTQVVSVHWQRLDQHVLQYIALDRLDVAFGTMLLKRVARDLIGQRVIGINHQYRDNRPQFDCYMVAEWAGDVTNRLSTTTAGALTHGDHWMEERSVMRKVRAASSGEAEFHGLGTREVMRLLTKHICGEDREQTKILVAYFDSMASHMEQQLGASESCNDKVKWLSMRQGIDKIELWTLTNLMGMNLERGLRAVSS